MFSRQIFPFCSRVSRRFCSKWIKFFSVCGSKIHTRAVFIKGGILSDGYLAGLRPYCYRNLLHKIWTNSTFPGKNPLFRGVWQYLVNQLPGKSLYKRRYKRNLETKRPEKSVSDAPQDKQGQKPEDEQGDDFTLSDLDEQARAETPDDMHSWETETEEFEDPLTAEPEQFDRMSNYDQQEFADEAYQAAIIHAGRQAVHIRFWSRIAAIAFALCLIIGWPLGSSWANYETTGQWRLVLGYDPTVLVLFALVPICFVFLGLILSHFIRLTARAEALSDAARFLTEPEAHAVEGVRNVGSAVQEEISTLNRNLDDALGKLATAESMIRQQVRAIEQAREAIDGDGSGLANAVAVERENLMKLTESMSEEADAFAAAIAEQAQNSLAHSLNQSQEMSAALGERESDMQARLTALENAAEQAFNSLEKLSNALEQQNQTFLQHGQVADEEQVRAETLTKEAKERLSENTDALSQAKQSLEVESERLEELITEQKDRAERLAQVISEQAERLQQLNSDYDAAEEAAIERKARLEQAAQEAAQTAAKQAADHAATLAAQQAAQEAAQKAAEEAAKSAAKQAAERAAERVAQQAEQARQQQAELAVKKSSSTRLSISGIDDQSGEPSPKQDPKQANGFEGFLRDIAGRKQDIPDPQPKSLREERQHTPWSDILAAADEGEDTLDLQPEDKIDSNEDDQVSNDVVDRIRKMQRFTLYLIEELYGPPPSATIERFESGERNIFAHLLLRRNEEDVKLRLQNKSAEDLPFREMATEFLTEFDTLLEPATGASNSETLLDDYLASPLGQVYIIVGSALDYFA